METPTTPANPYTSPTANPYGAAISNSGDAVSPSTIAQLNGTKGWVRFMSVIAWLLTGFLLLASAIMGVISAMGLNKAAPTSPFGGKEFVALAIVYGLMAFAYIYPAIKLWKYANRIGSLSASRSVADLDAALNEQRGFWKFAGIMTIILICGYIIFFIGLFAFVGTAAMKAGTIPMR